MTTNDEPRLLRVPEVAKQLALTERHVWRLIERGELKAIRLGERATRVEPDEVAAYVERCKAGAA